MSLIASPTQLRDSFARWALFLVPLTILLGFMSGQLGEGPASDWFRALEKPDIFPPPAVFGIVWSVLYAMIGLAVAMVASARGAVGRGLALVLFVLHFIFNLAWSPAFFGLQDMQLALIIDGLMVVTLLPVLWAFWRIRKAAAILLIPYLGWICFAGVLNYAFIEANPRAVAPVGEAQQRIEI